MDPVVPATVEVARSPVDAVDPPVATEVCSPVPVEVDGDGGDAAVGVWLAVVCPVELAGGGGVPAADVAVGVRLLVVRSVAVAEVDSGDGCGVVVASVGAAGVVV